MGQGDGGSAAAGSPAEEKQEERERVSRLLPFYPTQRLDGETTLVTRHNRPSPSSTNMVFQPVHVAGKRLQRTFDHLLNTAKKRAGQGVPTRVQSDPKFVQPKDRIALWNIAHGDRVMVRTGKHKGRFGTVDYVDRTHNRVFLAEPEFGVSRVGAQIGWAWEGGRDRGKESSSLQLHLDTTVPARK